MKNISGYTKKASLGIKQCQEVLEEAYGLHGYRTEMMTKGYMRVYFTKQSKTPDVLIKIDENYMDYNKAKKHLIDFEKLSLSENCRNYKLISLLGFSAECSRLKGYSMVMDDLSLIFDMIECHNSGMPYIELFEHNRNTVEEILDLWQRKEKAAAVQATGTGKTIVIAKIVQILNEYNVLYVAPSNYILDQFREKFEFANVKIEYMTYQKLLLMENDIDELKADLIVLDEYHRAGASEWGKCVDKLLQNNSESLVLGLSATPVRYLDGMRNMTEEIFDNNSTKELSLTDAIARGILPAPKYVSALYALKDEAQILKAKLENGHNANLVSELQEYVVKWEESKGVPEIIRKHIDKDMNKFVVFCRNIEHLHSMIETVEEWFKIAGKLHVESFIVYSTYKNSERNFVSFKNGRSENTTYLLFTVDMLNEGIHLDDISGVFMLRGTLSPIVYLQQIGRAIQAGNSHSPVIFDLVNNFSSVQYENLSEGIWESYRSYNRQRKSAGLPEVLSDFRVIDETQDILKVFKDLERRITTDWDEMFSQLVEFKKEYGHSDTWKIEGCNELKSWCRTQRGNAAKGYLNAERIERLNRLNFSWSVKETFWEDKLGEYIRLRENKLKNTPAMEKWIWRQRKDYKSGALPEDKIQKLMKAGLQLEMPEKEDWYEMFEILKEYKERFGDVDVPEEYITDEGIQLGDWVRRQNAFYRFGRRKNDKWELLKDIGFIYRPKEDNWHKNFNKLKKAMENNSEPDEQTRYWGIRQREAHKKGKLKKERADLFRSIGFDIDKKNHDETWRHMIGLLKEYKREHGNTLVPAKYKTKGGDKLGGWVSEARLRLKDKLDNPSEEEKQRIEELNSIGFIWDVLEWQWREKFKAYIKKRKSGTPLSDVLSNWVSTQRTLYKEGKLSESRMELLKTTDILKK